ncbi:MAG: ketoacyl-ACP synthase III [Alphaproteobacteria bacterium]|nr:ketoacyl-ACP synthase III [Alphaproteobacteria bacterium]MCL2504919.1 ketoacyl-ACP synthase III [Alphaproteobacteria bacterium]
MIRTTFLNCGAYLPENAVTNAALIAKHGLDSSDEWVERRTGIKQRHIAGDNEKTSDLATRAAGEALQASGLTIKDIDAVIVATTTPDLDLPATAVKVQVNLGMNHGFAFDVHAVCSGFIYAITVADNLIKAGQIKRAVVIGAETLSRIVDFTDRSTCFLFGDGAGAVILEGKEGVHNDNRDQGILGSILHSDGRYYDVLKTNEKRFIAMDGKEVFRHAIVNMSSVIDELLEKTGLAESEIDWLVPHQANERIIDNAAKKLKLPEERVVKTISFHANTSAASIPLALCHAVKSGEIQRGQIVLMDAMGAGFTWGAAAVRW